MGEEYIIELKNINRATEIYIILPKAIIVLSILKNLLSGTRYQPVIIKPNIRTIAQPKLKLLLRQQII